MATASGSVVLLSLFEARRESHLAEGVIASCGTAGNGRDNFSGKCQFLEHMVFSGFGQIAGEAGFILDTRVGEGGARPETIR